MLMPLDVAPFAPTAKRPGDRVLTSRRCHVIGDDLGPVPDVHPDYHDAPYLAAQKNLPGWVWAAMGIGLGVIVVLGLVGVV